MAHQTLFFLDLNACTVFLHPETKLRGKFSNCFIVKMLIDGKKTYWQRAGDKLIESTVISDINECNLVETGSPSLRYCGGIEFYLFFCFF